MGSTKCGRKAHERRALTGEAGNASRRQVDLREALRAAQNGPVRAGRRTSRPNFSRVMRINFGVRMAEIFREHSDSLVPCKAYYRLIAKSYNHVLQKTFLYSKSPALTKLPKKN
jgi:hypothetical protein